MRLMPRSSAAWMALMASLSLLPPHIQPPIAHVPSATREARMEVPGISTNSMSARWDWLRFIAQLLPRSDGARHLNSRPGKYMASNSTAR